MIRIRNTSQFPPGGFPYKQPETGRNFPGMVPFSQQKAEILQYRQQNNLPGADEITVETDLHCYTCTRLGNDPTFCGDGPVVTSQKKTLWTGIQRWAGAAPAAVSGAVERFEQLDAGTRILRDWLGDGGSPVPKTQAQARSDVCTGRFSGNRCPANQKEGWSIPMAVARRIQEHLSKKHELNLTVEDEKELGTCKACGCNLELKVHTPFQHIFRHTSDAQFAKFKENNPNCWVVKEHEQTTKTPA